MEKGIHTQFSLGTWRI